MNINKNIKVALMALAAFMATGSMTSCSDEPEDILASCLTTRL